VRSDEVTVRGVTPAWCVGLLVVTALLLLVRVDWTVAHSSGVKTGLARAVGTPGPKAVLSRMSQALLHRGTYHIVGQSRGIFYVNGRISRADLEQEHGDISLRTLTRHEFFVLRLTGSNLAKPARVQRYEAVGVGNDLAYRYDRQPWGCSRNGDVYYLDFLPYVLAYPHRSTVFEKNLGAEVVQGRCVWHVQFRPVVPAAEQEPVGSVRSYTLVIDDFIDSATYLLVREEQTVSALGYGLDAKGHVDRRRIISLNAHSGTRSSRYGEAVRPPVPPVCRSTFQGHA
jgi:hypothetical protein